MVNASVTVETRNYSANISFWFLWYWICHTVINCLPWSYKWLCANKYIPIDPYKFDKVIVQQPAAFIQSNDDQTICMENSLHTNGDIIVNTAFKELKFLISRPLHLQNVSNAITTQSSIPNYYPECTVVEPSSGAEQWASEYSNRSWQTRQPAPWASLQENRV